MSAPILLEVQNLRVAFEGREVVHGVDFQIRAGERLALVGESGSGKSVTALAILRLLESARIQGSVRWQGQELLAQSERDMQRIRGDEIAMIFQEPMTALNPLMTVGQQIAEVLQLKKAWHYPEPSSVRLNCWHRPALTPPSAALTRTPINSLAAAPACHGGHGLGGRSPTAHREAETAKAHRG